MTLVLLDTNAYLRLAKRIKPLLGKPFGQKGYVLTILKDTESEVRRNGRLRHNFPWFQDPDLANERLAKSLRFKDDEKATLASAVSVLHGWVQAHVSDFAIKGRSPPSVTDCRLLAICQIRSAIVATDDLGMHRLAETFEIDIWHGHELLKKMLSAKMIKPDQVREIYLALEANGDLPVSWEHARHTSFRKVL